MVAKEFYLGQISLEEEEEAGDEESNLLQDSRDDSDAEAEEALSLCDLPLYSNSSISAQWVGGNNNFSKEYKKNSSQSNKEEDDDDFFEFFSEDFTTSNSTTTYHHRTFSDNIIFCGKLIPFKDPPKNTDESSNMIQKGSNTFVPWRSNSTSRSRSNSKAMMMQCNNNKGGISHGGAKGNNNLTSFSSSCEYSSIGKVSLLRSPTKSRWFLFMFGMTRLSTNTGNMELRDIRNRQSRNSRKTKFVAAATPENRGEVVEKMMMKEGEGKGNCKGLWKVLRSISMGLGCSSSSKLANDVVKATFV